MALLVDNDALLKLARYDLLDKVLEQFSFDYGDVRVLAAAKYVLLPARDRLRHCKDEACADRLERFLSLVGKLDATTADRGIVDALAAVPNIDPGEALMLAAGATDPDCYIITGDKRALAAVGESELLFAVRVALRGRILSLELLFSFLIEGDFANVQNRIRLQPSVDKTLANIFGVSTPSSLQSVRDGLDSYIAHLRAQTGVLLHPPPASS
ncbi:hypothetical protein [Paraburkholderia kururiensis]|jgi:hypothetical protein|uniref:hypothetical protein n=1 Tax=Paraburkholderia kururiensis TaxID=984307 RepID=UPI0018F45888|nr:hypothetical protein [Paraburkholderia kururiensis]